jgi:hypothetical protein
VVEHLPSKHKVLNSNPVPLQKTDKWNGIKLKSFYISKVITAGIKRQPTHRMGENLCQLSVDKRLISRIHKKLKKKNQTPK